GDTAGKIARMHRVSLADLVLANDLDRRATVYVRQTLRIPQGGETAPAEPQRPPAEPAEDAVLSADAKVTPPEAPIPAAGPAVLHRRSGPAPADLLAMAAVPAVHDLPDTDDLPAAAMPAAVVSLDVGFSRVDKVNRQPVGILEVQVEETLGHYAEWAGIRASRIRHFNQLPFGRPLKLHQQIKIPLNGISAEDFEARRYEFHKRLQEDFFAVYRVGELQRYRVQAGDSYWTLCREKFDLPLWLLKQYNSQVNLAALRIDQSLTIPAIESLADNDPGAVSEMAMPDA
ncbi:MAG TPA: LysM peptidoglycan-binding domain-containing protein, partial [Desulfosarcina sp.]|nr:LysM peptidoglycan-binding domain-containing protein [Desulfosarcina sp.]